MQNIAVSYTRVSTKEQATENFSLGTQKTACEERARRDGFQIVRVFEDAGESAKTADRPALLELLDYCAKQRGVVTRVYAYNVSRLARRTEDHLMIRGVLAKLGVGVVSVTEALDDSPAGKLTETLLAAIAQFDNDQRSARTTEGMKTATSAGRWTHQAPVGYKNAGRGKSPSLVPDPQKAPLVVEAFRRIAAGEDATRVRRDAERAGLVSRGGRLARTTFYRMLSSRIYVSVVETKLGSARGDWQPLVTIDLFHRAQLALRRPEDGGTKKRYTKLRADFGLRGVIRCGCGRRITAFYARGKSGARYPYYRCVAPVASRRATCLSIAVPKLDAAFVEWLGRLRPAPGFLRLYRETVVRAWKGQQAAIREERAAAKKRLDEVNAKMDRLTKRALLEDEAFDPAAVRRVREELERERLVAEVAVGDLDCDALDVEAVLSFAEHVLTNAGRLWVEATPEQRVRLTTALFPEGVTYEAGVFKTPSSAFEFNDLRGSDGEKERMASPEGVEPSF